MALGRDLMVQMSLLPLFSGMNEADLASLLEQASEMRLADGAILFAQGEAVSSLFLLLDGHVELLLDKDGRSGLVEILGRQAILGETALVGEGTHEATARVVGFARVLAIPGPSFRSILESRFDLALGMMAAMSIRLRGMVGHIVRLKLKSAAQRLAVFLLGLARAEEGPARVRFPYDKRLAAEDLGMSPESLSRALASLAGLGVESRPDNLVLIEDLGRLKAFSAEEAE